MTVIPISKSPAALAANQMASRRVRLRRQMLNLSQEALAKASGLSPQQIHKYETGQNRISAGMLAQFARILDVPVSFFFDEGENRSDLPPDLLDLLSHEDTTECLKMFLALSDRERSGIKKLMQTLMVDQPVVDEQGDDDQGGREQMTYDQANEPVLRIQRRS